jgi:4-amino-4-deoxy-L-arabinose transferase-like glycosyltransferase
MTQHTLPLRVPMPRGELSAVAYRLTALVRLGGARLALTAIVASGAALRFSLLSGFRFHPDEALYATWARLVATGQDVMLVEHAVDKPPLLIYVLASLFATLGASEEIARLPNELAGAAAILLLYGIAIELYHDRRVGLAAAAVLAFSPISILFAPTAFTDPLMTCLLLAAVWCGLRGQPWLCGLGYGLALATKQDALVFAPLLFLLPIVRDWVPSATRNVRASAERLARFAVGVALPASAVIVWSTQRPQPDFLQVSLANYGGFNLAQPEVYAARALEWLPLLRTVSSEWLLIMTLLTLPLVVMRERRTADWVLITIAGGWLAFHVIFMIPAWDRYVLPLVPLCALLMARCAVYCSDRLRPPGLNVAAAFIAGLLLAVPARSALRDEIHVGRDFNLHAGVDQVGQWFWTIDTSATILYYHDLSWELDYYTFGRELDRRWFIDAEQLAADAARMPLARRFVVVAEWESAPNVIPAALAREHLRAEPVFIAQRTDSSPAARVFQILPEDVPGSGRANMSSSGFGVFVD